MVIVPAELSPLFNTCTFHGCLVPEDRFLSMAIYEHDPNQQEMVT